MTPPTRRAFLTSAAAATAASATLHAAPNDVLNVGLIGVGGRCRHLLQALVKIPNVRVVASCDVYEPHREAVRGQIDPKAAFVQDYREVLGSKDIDAVLIATPDHWHVPLTVAACAAGKDVYVEKPLTHDLAEGAAVIKAQNDHKRIVQVGTQQRSMPHYEHGFDLIKAGRLGRICKAHLTWNRNADRARRGKIGIDPGKLDWPAFLGSARQQPFDEYRYANWRWFWDFGGGIFTDLMVHHLDNANRLMGLATPLTAHSVGSFHSAEGVWETPDTVQTLLTYAGGVQVYFEGTFSNARNGSMLEIMGTDGTLYLDRGRMEFTPERGRGEPVSEVIGTGPRGRDFYDKPDGELVHLTNWVECCRSRQTPNSPAEAGVLAAAGAHLANRSLRSGRAEKWPG